MQKTLSFSDGDGYKIECLLDLNDVSALTKIKAGTLRKYILRKTMPYVKIGSAVRFRISEIDVWLKGNSFMPERLRTISNEQ